MILNTMHALSGAALLSVASAAKTLRPIEDLSQILPGHPVKRSLPNDEVFIPHNEYTFHYAQADKKYAMIADFKLQAPGEFNGILAMEEFADRTKSIHCDDEANLITIEFSSKEEYDHAYKVWDWVNDKEDNTFTLVTKADQCGDPDVRDPYAVTDITFDESTLMAKLAATAQTWGDAVHDCELNTRTIHYTGKKARKARRQDDTSSDHWNSTVSEAEDAQNICDADDDEFCTNDYLDWELEEEDDVPDYEFLTPEIISTIDELERLEGRLTAANETNSTAQHPLQERVEKTYDLLLDLIDNRTMELLNDTAEMYGEELPEIGAAVANATTMYNQFMGEADLKFQEANKIAENDTDASWGLWEEALYLQDQATDVLQEALVAVTSHVQALHGIESEEDNVEARSLLRRSAKIHLQNKRNIGKWFADLGKKIKGAFVGVANGLANLLGANKPARLNLAQKFAPPKFTIDKNQYGIGFEAGPEFESGGNIVGLVEVKIQADKPSIFRVKVTPENIFAQAKYVVDADGTLKENFEKEIAGTTIPVPGAAIDIKGLIHIGPSVYAGLWAGIPKLEAKQAHFEVGAIARIPKDSVILLDIVNSKNNKVKGWTPNIEQIGPKFTGDLQGELAMWVSLALKFDANIFGGKFGGKAEIEAQAPRFGLQFQVEGNTEKQCDGEKKDSAISIGADVGININAKASLSPGDFNFKKDIFTKKWPLFNKCFYFGENTTPNPKFMIRGMSY